MRKQQLAVCIENKGYWASLETRKIYLTLSDPAAVEHSLLRIVDESGDSYLYPKMLFRLIKLPRSVMKAVLAAA
jgi:hypothetical protein